MAIFLVRLGSDIAGHRKSPKMSAQVPPEPLPPIELTLGPTKKNFVKIEPEIPILQVHHYTLLGTVSPLRGLPRSPPNLSPQSS